MIAVVALVLGWAEQAGGREPPAPVDRSELEAWAEGPVRWLLLPAERRDLAAISTPAEALRFVERFWARRDPDPSTEINPFRERFYRRVEAADLLYVEGGVRGSLTDRGRALILLGSPTGLRVTSTEALEWDPSTGSADNVKIRYLPLEIWTYQLEDLRRPLREALVAVDEGEELRVSFVRDVDGTRLSEGEDLLDLALRTALALDDER